MAAPGARLPRPKFLKVLLPCCLHKLRVPDRFARALDGGDGGEVIVVGPLGKVWRVEACRNGEEVFLGGGWAEFVRAHGIGVGWFVVFRYEGSRVLSVKAFDTSCCRRDFCTPLADVTNKYSIAARRPQFVKVLLPEFFEKMRIPPKFVRHHLTKNYISQMAIIFSPAGKFWRIGLDRDQSDVFLGSGWTKFLMAHDLSEGNILMFRYEGNMAFTVSVFDLDGCQKEYKAATSGLTADEEAPTTSPQKIKKQPEVKSFSRKRKQPEVKSFSRKRKRESQRTSRAEGKKRKNSPASVKEKEKLKRQSGTDQPQHLITRKITARALSHCFTLGRSICSSFGLPSRCTIKLKTSVQSKRSWPVTFMIANTYGLFKTGWKEFCEDNNVKVGDLCTINILKTNVWLVMITSS